MGQTTWNQQVNGVTCEKDTKATEADRAGRGMRLEGLRFKWGGKEGIPEEVTCEHC